MIPAAFDEVHLLVCEGIEIACFLRLWLGVTLLVELMQKMGTNWEKATSSSGLIKIILYGNYLLICQA